MIALDVLWATVISYWTNIVKRRAMKQELIHRSLISHLRVHFKKDTQIARQRVGNMFIYQVAKSLLLKHPLDIMQRPRKCVLLIHDYSLHNL